MKVVHGLALLRQPHPQKGLLADTVTVLEPDFGTLNVGGTPLEEEKRWWVGIGRYEVGLSESVDPSPETDEVVEAIEGSVEEAKRDLAVVRPGADLGLGAPSTIAERVPELGIVSGVTGETLRGETERGDFGGGEEGQDRQLHVFGEIDEGDSWIW